MRMTRKEAVVQYVCYIGAITFALLPVTLRLEILFLTRWVFYSYYIAIAIILLVVLDQMVISSRTILATPGKILFIAKNLAVMWFIFSWVSTTYIDLKLTQVELEHARMTLEGYEPYEFLTGLRSVIDQQFGRSWARVHGSVRNLIKL